MVTQKCAFKPSSERFALHLERVRASALLLLFVGTFAAATHLSPHVGLAETTLPDTLPTDAKRLQTEDIKSLLGTGATFEFVGAGGRATGTSTWNLSTGTAYGTFIWDKTLQGTWNLYWKVEDDLSCLRSSANEWECELIYQFGDGFFEVDADGTLHTFTQPKVADPLPEPLSVEEAAELLPDMMKWAQKVDLTVVSSGEQDGVIDIGLSGGSGSPTHLRIEADSGALLSSN